MEQKIYDFREDSINLLCFKILRMGNSRFLLSFKNGKKEKRFSLEEFIEKLNTFLEGSNIKLQIVER